MPGGFGLDTGWTFYTPYSSPPRRPTARVAALLGVFILGFSSILTGVNFIATIHMLRPKGMGWFRMPLFLWALYATSVIQILATPVLAITGLLLLAERVARRRHLRLRRWAAIRSSSSTSSGSTRHPAVYIMILPAMGVISEVITTHSRKHIFGYNFIAYSSIAIALLSFLVWGHHMFTSGQSPLANAIFSLLTFTVADPVGASRSSTGSATLYSGDIRFTTPMICAHVVPRALHVRRADRACSSARSRPTCTSTTPTSSSPTSTT